MFGTALALVLLPTGVALGDVVALGPFGRGALWVSLAGISLALAIPGAPDDPPPAALWIVYLAATTLVLFSHHPLLLCVTILLVALVVPALGPVGPALAWRRTLAVGAVLLFLGFTVERLASTQVSNLSIAGALVAGFLLVVGAAPFGAAFLLWLRGAGRRLAAVVGTCLGSALVVVVSDWTGSLNSLQLFRANRPGTTIAVFGALTLVGASLYALTARGWRQLATDGIVADLALAVVAVSADGQGGAALALVSMLLVRPSMLLLDRAELPWPLGRVATLAALLGGAGMPPTVGFAARLLVLGATFGLSQPLTGLLLLGLVMEAAATGRVVLRQVSLGRRRPAPRRALATLLAAALVPVLAVTAGLFPGLLLHHVWGG